MKHLKALQKLAFCAALAVLALGMAPARAAGTSPTGFGDCVGADDSGGAGKDCVTAVGHISASVVGTLSINEMHALSFGNFAVARAGGTGGATISVDVLGNRTQSAPTGGDTIVLLHGADATGGPGAAASGSQAPGHFTVSGGQEGGTTQVYISFADDSGNIVDTCSPGAGFVGTGPCDTYHPNDNQLITLNGPGTGVFYVSQFVFNERGSDVYGHYIDNDGSSGNNGSAGPPVVPNTNPGIANPYKPGGPTNGTTSGAGVADIVVGATLATDGTGTGTYLAGKYFGTYNVMVSY